MKNLIYAGLNTASTVNAGGVIPLNIVVRRFNRQNAASEINLVGNAISIEVNSCRAPRYNAVASITFAGAAGNGVISIYQDGVAIPLANATATITTADTEFVTVTIPVSIRTNNCATTALTLVNTGTTALNITNASILVIED